MATRPRSARAALAAAKQRTQMTRMGDFAAPSRKVGNAIRGQINAGKRPVFPKGYSKAGQNAAVKYARDQRARGKRVNVNEMHRKAVAAHAQVYAGAAGRRATDRAERRSGNERRRT